MTKLLPLLPLLFVHGVVSHAAGLDCSDERLSPVEKMICSDSKLSDYDQHLNYLFHKTIGVSTAHEQRQVLDEQRQWQIEIRDKCDSWMCLHGAYQTRLNVLSNTYQTRWQSRIPDVVMIELSRRSATSVEELKEVLGDCPRSQTSMNLCALRSFVEADLTMRSVLAKKLETLSLCHATLQTSQANWENDRDSQCKKQADRKAEGDLMRPMIFTSCQAETTEQRTVQLKSIRTCDGIR